MRNMLTLIASCSLLALVACSSSDPQSAVSPGVVGANDSTSQSCPATCEQSASPGAVSETGGCPYSGESSADASLGVVGDDAAKSGCCSESNAKSTSLGVVSDDSAKSGCCSSKSAAPSSCSKSDTSTSLGVVSDDAAKSGCCSKGDAKGTSLGVVGDSPKGCPSSKPATGGDCSGNSQSL